MREIIPTRLGGALQGWAALVDAALSDANVDLAALQDALDARVTAREDDAGGSGSCPADTVDMGAFRVESAARGSESWYAAVGARVGDGRRPFLAAELSVIYTASRTGELSDLGRATEGCADHCAAHGAIVHTSGKVQFTVVTTTIPCRCGL